MPIIDLAEADRHATAPCYQSMRSLLVGEFKSQTAQVVLNMLMEASRPV